VTVCCAAVVDVVDVVEVSSVVSVWEQAESSTSKLVKQRMRVIMGLIEADRSNLPTGAALPRCIPTEHRVATLAAARKRIRRGCLLFRPIGCRQSARYDGESNKLLCLCHTILPEDWFA
jgi:hypothetical protein